MPKKARAVSNPILVTGAAGFIAFHVIEELLRRGQPVVGVDCFDPFYGRSLKEANLADLSRISSETGTRFEFRENDICRMQDGDFVGHQFGAVIHLAAKAGVQPSLKAP